MIPSTLMAEAISSSEKSALKRAKPRHFPEDGIFHIQCSEKLNLT
jgi:hypothetical protein